MALTLFLRSSRLLGLSLRPLLPHPHQSSLTPRLSQPPIRALLSLRHLPSLNLTHSLLPRYILNRQHSMHMLRSLLLVEFGNFFLAAVGSLMLAGAAGEEDKTLAVGF